MMEEKSLSIGDVVREAARDALRGGAAGAIAMGANVGALMWMRTTVRPVRLHAFLFLSLCFVYNFLLLNDR